MEEPARIGKVLFARGDLRSSSLRPWVPGNRPPESPNNPRQQLVRNARYDSRGSAGHPSQYR
jgi:hypothetical protein